MQQTAQERYELKPYTPESDHGDAAAKFFYESGLLKGTKKGIGRVISELGG